MIITNITVQKDSSRINLYVDGEFYLGLPVEAIIEYKLKKGKELDEETANKIKGYAEFDKVKFAALNYLSYRQRSIFEMEEYLLKKDFDNDSVASVISWLKESDYLNDERFAESYVLEKTRLNNLGAYRLKIELKQKGITDEIISEVLTDHKIDLNELTALVRRKYSAVLSEDRNTQYRKIGGYLQRKGYSYDVVKKIIERLSNGEQ
jgi:regulatory protein